MKKYNIVYADPPWSYNDKMVMEGVHGPIRGSAAFYDTMTLSDIKGLPIQDICEKDCILFIWVTMPLLQEGLDVIKAWGFKYKTCGFTWVKKSKNNKIHCGMGHYTRGNAELCLIGLKGKVSILSHSVYQIVESQIGRHSEKPAIIRDKIIELVGDLPRIELFARQSTIGWDVFGNEVKDSINLNHVRDNT